MSHEDLLYVCDRTNNRIQIFTRAGEFKHEFRVEMQTLSNGSVWDMVLSHDAAQKFMYVADGANGANGRIYILRRSDGQGNLYTAEVGFGRRVQKFLRGGGGF